MVFIRKESDSHRPDDRYGSSCICRKAGPHHFPRSRDSHPRDFAFVSSALAATMSATLVLSVHDKGKPYVHSRLHISVADSGALRIGSSIISRIPGPGHIQRVSSLPEGVRLYSCYGAGSLCGAGMRTGTGSTPGYECRIQPLFRLGEEQFLGQVLLNLSLAPHYCARMKHTER